jgi:hypothetical protein
LFDHRPVTKKLHAIVQGIMTDVDVSSSDTCMSDYHMVLGMEMKKLKKVEIKGLNDVVYFVPDAVAAHTKHEMMTKKDMCDKLVSHYGKAIDAVRLLKHVYDTENQGGGSFWGRIRDDNLITEKAGSKIVEIKFCEKMSASVNLGDHVRGLEEFVSPSGLLKVTERNVFLHQFHSIVQNVPLDMSMLACGDELFNGPEYRALFNSDSAKVPWMAADPSAPQCKRYKELGHLADKQLTVSSVSNAPFVRKGGACQKMRTLNIQNIVAKDRATLVKMYKAMSMHAQKNLQDVQSIINELVKGSPSTGYEMRHMTDKQLSVVLHRVKRAVATYYLATLYDFKTLVATAVDISKRLK